MINLFLSSAEISPEKNITVTFYFNLNHLVIGIDAIIKFEPQIINFEGSPHKNYIFSST